MINKIRNGTVWFLPDILPPNLNKKFSKVVLGYDGEAYALVQYKRDENLWINAGNGRKKIFEKWTYLPDYE